ncbi:MAG TPA: DNA/RNA nuclease SfsA [Clostridia bacterium]|nr:DNA/RNA nuclease SfsA [Clostridia bacterium]
MLYKNICKGIFQHRPNRFVAEVEIAGNIKPAHVKNTGRLKELLVKGARVILQKADNPNRKTKYDLVAVWKNGKLVNIDSMAPNEAFLKYLRSGQYIDNITFIKPETTYKESRFDFYVEAGKRKIFIEIKGVTLEKNGVALFPDAPTERGIKHLNQLADSIDAGYEAHNIYIIQMSDVSCFTPNSEMHADYVDAFVKAEKAGVRISAYDCIVKPDDMVINKKIPHRIKEKMQ